MNLADSIKVGTIIFLNETLVRIHSFTSIP